MDKENLQHHQQQHGSSSGSPKTVPVKSASAAQPPLTRRTAAFRVPSPIALHQTLSQLSLATDSSPARASRRLADNVMGLRATTPTRLMGDPPAIRRNLQYPGLSSSETTRPHRRRVVKCRRRRSHQTTSSSPPTFLPRPSSPDVLNTSQVSAVATPTSSEQSSVYSLAHEFTSMDVDQPPSTPMERTDCINPVAFTLWRGGEEDREWLQEQDRASSGASVASSSSTPLYSSHNTATSSPSSSLCRIPAPLQVSNNLRDVYGANYSCEISRPIPMMARRQEDYYY